jgi:ribosomal protein S18 acetylase RimI-like enzyme
MKIKLINEDSFSQVAAIASYHVSDTFNMPKSMYGGVAAFDDKGQMVAYILLTPERNNVFSIPSLATRHGYENQGLMQDLFKYVFDKMNRTLWLEAHPANEKAVALYKKLGFTFTQGRATYRDGVPCLLGERVA